MDLAAALPTPFAVFFACWVLLGIGCWIFYATADYQTKKSAHPVLMIATGILFIGFAEWLMRGHLPWFVIIVVAFITFLNIRSIEFCPRCNATLYRRGFWRSRFCYRCGAELDR